MISSRYASLAAMACAFLSVATAASAQDIEQAGVAAAVRGDVVLVAAAPASVERVVGKNLGSGDRIFLGDEISTGPNSGMQIMLLDETIFTIGPDAGLVIDEFVYDPATNAGQVTASVVKGAFRFVSGRVAKEEPRNMNVKTPVGTIGIRGTSAAGNVVPAGPDTPPRADFVLLGPGVDNNAGERAGRILVSNGGTTVEITRSGYGTSIAGLEGIPTLPVRLTPGQVAALTGGLGTDGGARPANNDGQAQGQNGSSQNQNGQTEGGNNQRGTASRQTGNVGTQQSRTRQQPQGANLGQTTNLSGQNLGSGITSANVLNSVTSTQTAANQQQTTAAQISASNLLSAVTTFEQLQTIQSGTATFNAGTIALNYQSGTHTNSGGSYGANVTIDFGARTIDLVISNVTYFFNGNGNNAMFVFEDNPGANNGNFDNDTGNVAETWTTSANPGKFSTMPTDGSSVRIRAAILNNVDANVIAERGRVEMTIQDSGSDTVISGSATTTGQYSP